MLEQEAAYRGARRRADDGDGAPNADGGVALNLILKGQANQRQGSGHHDGRTET